jgi:hypothetical protein
MTRIISDATGEAATARRRGVTAPWAGPFPTTVPSGCLDALAVLMACAARDTRAATRAVRP